MRRYYILQIGRYFRKSSLVIALPSFRIIYVDISMII